MERIVAYCGLVCSACDVYIATKNDDDELRQKLAERYTTEGRIAKPEDFNCDGCFDIPYEGCEVRQCASPKGLKNCAHCEEYVCETLASHFDKSPKSKEVLEGIIAQK